LQGNLGASICQEPLVLEHAKYQELYSWVHQNPNDFSVPMEFKRFKERLVKENR